MIKALNGESQETAPGAYSSGCWPPNRTTRGFSGPVGLRPRPPPGSPGLKTSLQSEGARRAGAGETPALVQQAAGGVGPEPARLQGWAQEMDCRIKGYPNIGLCT